MASAALRHLASVRSSDEHKSARLGLDTAPQMESASRNTLIAACERDVPAAVHRAYYPT